MATYFSAISIILAFVGYGPYFKDTFSGKTKPHLMSWLIWAMVSFIAFGLQFSDHAGVGAYTSFTMGIFCTIIFLKALSNGTKDIKKIDVISIVLALVAIVLWLVVKQPILSIILVILIDFLSFIPTIVKSWEKPWEETFFTWAISIFRQLFTIFALANITFVTISYPAYAIIINTAFCAMLVVRKQKIVKVN